MQEELDTNIEVKTDKKLVEEEKWLYEVSKKAHEILSKFAYKIWKSNSLGKAKFSKFLLKFVNEYAEAFIAAERKKSTEDLQVKMQGKTKNKKAI